jgi:hypothetical protein
MGHHEVSLLILAFILPSPDSLTLLPATTASPSPLGYLPTQLPFLQITPMYTSGSTTLTMSMDPLKSTRPSVQELSLVFPISYRASKEYSPSPNTQPVNPPFRM